MKQRMRFTPSGMALAIAAGAVLGLGSAPGRAAPLDISQAPLASSSDISVLPNVMFLLDDSGSMQFDTLPDHRPERAWRPCEPGKESGARGTWPASARPLWLLPSPRPLAEIGAVPQYEGPLTLLTLPERIESGWWDGDDARRDYFVARLPDASIAWVYRENGEWYVHGLFA